MKKSINLHIMLMCSIITTGIHAAGGVGTRRAPAKTPPRSIQQTIKAIKKNDQAIQNVQKKVQANATKLAAAKQTGSSADIEKEEAALKASLDQMNTLYEKGKDVFGSSNVGKQLRTLAEKRKNRFESELAKEKQRFLSLTTKEQQANSIAKQKSLENKINIEKIALGEKWSNAKKSALLATGATVAAAGLDWYLGTGYLKAGVAGAKLMAQKAQDWWNPALQNTVTPISDREMVAAYLPHMSPEQLPASTLEDLFIDSGMATQQPPAGWFPRATSGWQTFKDYLYAPVDWLSKKGKAGSIAAGLITGYVAQRQTAAQMQAAGWVFNTAKGYWVSNNDGRVAVNQDGTPYVATDQAQMIPQQRPLPKPTDTDLDED